MKQYTPFLLFCLIQWTAASIQILPGGQRLPMHDMYGEDDTRQYDFSGPLLRAEFVPDTWCKVAPLRLDAVPSNSSDDKGLAIYVDKSDKYNAGCPTVAWVLRSLPNDFVAQSNLTQYSTVLWIFVARDDSSVAFGHKEADPLDDYWDVLPKGVQVALVPSDAGLIISNTFMAEQNRNRTRYIALEAHIERDPGPWNRFLQSKYFNVATWLIGITNAMIAVAALIILCQAFMYGERPTWFKALALLSAVLFAAVDGFAQIRLPIRNYKIALMYAVWMWTNGLYTIIITRWSAFMCKIGSQRIPYYILLGLCLANVIVFGAAMIIACISLYSTGLEIRGLAFTMYSIIASALFGAEALAILYAAVQFMRYLSSLKSRMAIGLVHFLKIESIALFIFCVGRSLITIAALMLATGLYRTIVQFELTTACFHIGLLMVLSGIIWLMSMRPPVHSGDTVVSSRSVTQGSAPQTWQQMGGDSMDTVGSTTLRIVQGGQCKATPNHLDHAKTLTKLGSGEVDDGKGTPLPATETTRARQRSTTITITAPTP
ncbi:hypothetical protein GQ42DRAFT_157286 [Ramicandelaber brevisporus]|nr:hypothetical protein GQ42DRAFT_157286 [Ramicandelaber brevisporus]